MMFVFLLLLFLSFCLLLHILKLVYALYPCFLSVNRVIIFCNYNLSPYNNRVISLTHVQHGKKDRGLSFRFFLLI